MLVKIIPVDSGVCSVRKLCLNSPIFTANNSWIFSIFIISFMAVRCRNSRSISPDRLFSAKSRNFRSISDSSASWFSTLTKINKNVIKNWLTLIHFFNIFSDFFNINDILQNIFCANAIKFFTSPSFRVKGLYEMTLFH